MDDAIVWCDIPAKDIARAIRFYSAILGARIETKTFPGVTLALLPWEKGRAGAMLYVHVPDDRDMKLLAEAEALAPKVRYGPLVYLNCNGRLDAALVAVEQQGGKILRAKEAMGDFGFRAEALDSEGNRIALHSMI
jgi:hypothetical protein